MVFDCKKEESLLKKRRILVFLITVVMVLQTALPAQVFGDTTQGDGLANDLVNDEVKLETKENPVENNIVGEEAELITEENPAKNDIANRGNGSEHFDNSKIDLLVQSSEEEIWSYKEYIDYVDIDFSGTEQNLANPKIVLKIPNVYLDTATLNPTDLQTASSKTIEHGDEYTLVTYEFDKILGGSSFRIPIKLRSKFAETPNGYKLPLEATLYDENNNALKIASVETVQKTLEPRLTKYVLTTNSGYSTNDNKLVWADENTEEGNTVVRGDTAKYVRFFGAIETKSDTGSSSYGALTLKELKLTDILPEGAVFDPDKNPDWTLSDDGKSVSLNVEGNKIIKGKPGYDYRVNLPPLYLKFTGKEYGSSEINTIKIEAKEKNSEANFNLSDDITVILKNRTYANSLKTWKYGVSIFDRTQSKQGELEYITSLRTEDTKSNVVNIDIVDKNMDDRLYVTSLRVAGHKNNTSGGGAFNIEAVEGTFSLWAYDQDGNEKLIKNDVKNGDTVSLDNSSKKIVGFRLKGNDGAYIRANYMMDIKIRTKLKDPENTHYNVTDNSLNLFNNTAHVKAEFDGVDKQIDKDVTGHHTLRPYEPKFEIRKSQNKSNALANEEVTYKLIVGNHMYVDRTVPPDKIKVQKLVDILPVDMEYVEKSSRNIHNSMYDVDDSYVESIEPVVIDNYKNTGRTALIWTFTKGISGYQRKTIAYEAKVKQGAEEEIRTNDAYVIWENNGSNPDEDFTVFGRSGVMEDIYDIDEDGNTEENIMKASANIQIVPPKELLAYKYVNGSLDTDYIRSGGQGEIGSDFTYKLRLFNNSIATVKKLYLIDSLPRLGDRTIVEGENGEIYNRNSEFNVHLRGPIEVPKGYKVLYTKTRFRENLTAKEYENANHWVEDVDDWDDVEGFKIIMNESHYIDVGEIIEIIVPSKVESDMKIEDGEVSYNSYAISTNGEDYIEVISSSLAVRKYHLSGNVFVDEDDSKNISNNDITLEKIKVNLLDSNGNPALDLDGNPITTKTDKEGHYDFYLARSGNYKVSFGELNEYYLPIDKGLDTEILDSHINMESTNKFKTDEFTIDRENNNLIRNAGLKYDEADISIAKQYKDADGNILEGEGPFEFVLKVSGELYYGKAIIGEGEVDIADGKISLKSGEKAIIKLKTTSEYEVTEIANSQYIVTPEDSKHEGVVKFDNPEMIFINQEKKDDFSENENNNNSSKDENSTTKNANNKSPKTGDSFNYFGYLGLIFLSMGGILLIRRREKYSK